MAASSCVFCMRPIATCCWETDRGLALTLKEGNDYLDENADKLARKKLKTDASKRLFAINGKIFWFASLLRSMLIPLSPPGRLRSHEEGARLVSILPRQRRRSAPSSRHRHGHKSLPCLHADRGAC